MVVLVPTAEATAVNTAVPVVTWTVLVLGRPVKTAEWRKLGGRGGKNCAGQSHPPEGSWSQRGHGVWGDSDCRQKQRQRRSPRLSRGRGRECSPLLGGLWRAFSFSPWEAREIRALSPARLRFSAS